MRPDPRSRRIAAGAWSCLLTLGLPGTSSAGPICDGFWECLPLNVTMFSALATPLAFWIAIGLGVALARGFGRDSRSMRIVAWLVVVASTLVFVSGARIRLGTLMANRRYAISVNSNLEALEFTPKGPPCKTESSLDCRFEVGSSEVGPVESRSPEIEPSILLETGHWGGSNGSVDVWQVRVPDGPGPLCADVDVGSNREIDWEIVTSKICRSISQTSTGVPIYRTDTADRPTMGRQYSLVLDHTLFIFDVFDPLSPGEAGNVAQVNRLLDTFQPIPLAEFRHEPPDSLLRIAIRTAIWW